ncbi:hypothetical protein ACFQYP_50740 [Nonomuraea antimicrobica]
MVQPLPEPQLGVPVALARRSKASSTACGKPSGAGVPSTRHSRIMAAPSRYVSRASRTAGLVASQASRSATSRSGVVPRLGAPPM